MNLDHDDSPRPNLIFIFADQMRGMDMGCSGNPQVKTPNMDRLCGEGLRASNAVSTFPVCTPMRGCLLSGRYPTTTGVMENDVALPLDGKGLGHALKHGGYRTGWIGKWHLLGPEAYRGSYIPPGEHRHGFDYWAGINCSHQYMNGCYYLQNDPEPVWFTGYEPDVQTDLALDFISQPSKDPFALFLSWGPPHDPYEQVPQKYKDLYQTDKIEFRPNVPQNTSLYPPCLPENSPGREKVKDLRAYFSRSRSYREFPDPELIQSYYAAITALDDNLGRILDRIEENGQADNTLLIFTSDHGDMLYSQGAFQKNHPWEESIQVPFLLRYPGVVPAGSHTDRPFATVDIMPTVLELLGLPVPEYAEGVSFAPLMRGEKQQTPQAAFIMCAWAWNLPAWRGIRTERYTYTESRDGPLVVFDNKTDPYQLHNLVTDTAAAGTVRDLQKQCRDMAEEKGIPFDTWTVVSAQTSAANAAWVEKYGKEIKPCKYPVRS